MNSLEKNVTQKLIKGTKEFLVKIFSSTTVHPLKKFHEILTSYMRTMYTHMVQLRCNFMLATSVLSNTSIQLSSMLLSN